MTKVALIDDHKIFCESLTSLINNDFDGFSVCWSANDGRTAIRLLEQKQNLPDIVLLDIIMPDINGLDVAKWIFEHQKNIKILVLTTEEDDNSVIQMLRYGVKGYLLKGDSSEQLLTALQQVVKYGYYYPPIVMGNIHKHIEKKIAVAGPELSDREKELLKYICTGMKYAEIAKVMFLSESTVDTYRARLFEKFEVKNRVSLMLEASRMGLVKL